MFNSKEIADKALLRANDLKATYKRKRRLWEVIGVLLLCAVVCVVILIQNMDPSPSFHIDDGETALSAAPLSGNDTTRHPDIDQEDVVILDTD